jgi:AraC-like DNA-binding protein
MYTHLHLPRAQRLIWHWLETHPGRRPMVADLARIAGMTTSGLRRGLHKDRAAKCRDMITYGCLTYAARRISEGMRVGAAMTLSGFHSEQAFRRDCRDYLGCLPTDFRGHPIEPLKDWDEVESAQSA